MIGDPFVPLILYLALVLIVVGVMLGVPALLGERHGRKPMRATERGTGQAYESGIVPTGTAQLRIPLQYYLVAMLFVIFDLEAVYLYGWAVAAREAGWLGFVEVAVFIGLLLVALVYVCRVGVLDWSREHRHKAIKPARATTREKEREMVA
ncbi:MAG TPA: NADH-quinone oxidoreductase subunit A [Nitrospiraceae bacterium]|nr:NADH-quinone oxidoreductase subunit A [Nitrospiraceae bacterium]